MDIKITPNMVGKSVRLVESGATFLPTLTNFGKSSVIQLKTNNSIAVIMTIIT